MISSGSKPRFHSTVRIEHLKISIFIGKQVNNLFTYLPMKMEQTECSETSAYKIQTPGNYPEENIQHTEHGESLISRINSVLSLLPASVYSSGKSINTLPIRVEITIVLVCSDKPQFTHLFLDLRKTRFVLLHSDLQYFSLLTL